MVPVITCRGVGKTYRSLRRKPGLGGLVASLFRRETVELVAVRDVDLAIEPGQMVGLIGSNGAGPTFRAWRLGFRRYESAMS